MNLDAVLLFFNKFESLDYDKKDILLMSSAVLNKGIDINLSIRDNFMRLEELKPEFDSSKHLNKFVKNCDIPIYRMLLQEHDLYPILLDAMKNGLLTAYSFKDILECYMEAIDYVIEDENHKLLTHILELLSVKNNFDGNIINDSNIIRSFVKKNLFALNMPKMKKSNADTVSKKMIIIKLFRLGFIKFGIYNDVELSYEEVLQPLINQFNYGQIKLIVYNDNVLFEDLDYVEKYIHNAIDNNYDRSSEEDREYGEKCKDDISLCFTLRRDAEEVRKGSV